MGNALYRLAKYADIVANFFTCPVKDPYYATCHGSCFQKPFHTYLRTILHYFFLLQVGEANDLGEYDILGTYQ